MTPSELHEIISRGEDSKTQLKRQFDSIDALATEIAAMINSEGGLLIVGVSDSGEICGVTEIRQLNQWISNACSQKIEPPVSVITENLSIGDKLVVVISVPWGTDKPYAINKTAFWVKVGADVPKIGLPYRGLGSGVPRMIEEYRKANLPEPQFIEDKVAETFTVVFDRPRSYALQ